MAVNEVSGLSEASQQALLLKERKANSAWRKLKRNKSAMFGLLLVLFVTLVSIFCVIRSSSNGFPYGKC